MLMCSRITRYRPIIGAAACLLAVSLVGAADPSTYVRQATWPETMRLSRDARRVQNAASMAGEQMVTKAMAPDGRLATLAMPLAGAKVIYIGAGLNGNKRSGFSGYLLKVTLIDQAGNATVVDPKKLRKAPGSAGVAMFNQRRGKPVTVGADVYDRGHMFVQTSELTTALTREYERAEALVYVPKSGSNAAGVRFWVSTYPRMVHDRQMTEHTTLLWGLIMRDFPAAAAGGEIHAEQKANIWTANWPVGDCAELAGRYARACTGPLGAQAKALAKGAKGPADLRAVRALFVRERAGRRWAQRIEGVNIEAARLAIRDLAQTYPKRFKDAKAHLATLEAFAAEREGLTEKILTGDPAAIERARAHLAAIRGMLLGNPLLDFDRLIVLKRDFGPSARTVMSQALGLASLNSRTNETIRPNGWENEIAILSHLRGAGRIERLYKSDGGKPICEIDLHFDADRLMFSSIGTADRWHLFEMPTTGGQPRQLTPKDLPDVDFFDSCYLPDGKIATTSTASYQGLPCENGGRPMATMYRLDPATGKIRQLTFEQDSDWCPTVLNNGRLMYLRWEYTDIPHYFSRILFHCNPDGTGQMEYYGSNSYFPNAFFYARPIPGHPTQVVGIVGGHHGISRSGRLMILDPKKGRFEADGVVQEIPGRGKTVEPLIIDRLVNGVWPQFLNPYPLSGKYFIVSAKPAPDALWGIYLVDVFDNMTLIKEIEGSALIEPLPLRKTPTPPVIAERVDLSRKDAVVYLTDVYNGPGLKGIPRGTVKRLRLFSYHFAHHRVGGHTSVGVESSWDIKRILGTVPVESDGSALFRIPANVPISVQPLDADGRALQLMRSWLVGMPGETVSCAGCHERQNDVAPVQATIAAVRKPSEIEPWYGPARPFAFRHEVQPVLDKYCVGCHNGRAVGRPNFTGAAKRVPYKSDKAYMTLQQYVRRPGPESDAHLTTPMEYHASTSELILMFEKGHNNVQLDREAWSRLVTWIDLNAPYRGKWAPPERNGFDQVKRRLELSRLFANVSIDPEAEYDATAAALAERGRVKRVMPTPSRGPIAMAQELPGWPFSAAQAVTAQAAAGAKTTLTLQLGTMPPYKDSRLNVIGPMEVQLTLRLIPAGTFVMGSAGGYRDESPVTVVTVDKPFWIAEAEISNAAYHVVDPSHESGVIDRPGKDQNVRGEPADQADQPVVRVSWQEAMAFCRRLSEKIGRKVSLPTEAQWEWACRAGTDSAMWYGDVDDDFANFANFADSGAHRLPFPRVAKVKDGDAIAGGVRARKPNAWGLYGMHGNVAEWTRSDYRPYPYRAADGRNAGSTKAKKAVRGGSWRDRPKLGRSAHRRAYQSYQKVFNVGFRIVIEAE